jgi:hypothetical protein
MHNRNSRGRHDVPAPVVADGNGIFTLTLRDATQGWTQATQQAEPAR